MRRRAAAFSAVILLIASSAHAASKPPPKRGEIERCERVASRAACDPKTGYIAGPKGACRVSDLRCIEREWRRRGQVIYLPDVGTCGRGHEDGGDLVPCPPGVGPAKSSSKSPPRNGGNRTTSKKTASRTVTKPPPAPKVKPPTLDEALRSCPSLPSPKLFRNPDKEGATGMETWLWSDSAGTLRSSATIRGRRVTCTATPERWTWQTGDGAGYSRSSPGAAPPKHAATHVYERKGDYTQRVTVRWRLATTQGNGSAERSATRPYRVVEIRGALVE